ncbi:hypothetical protein [Paenarthrobacter sp. NPDC018779]|uniref:hypothetical protein n=1 Tax=Paenarthrobacter sp. NPDC018779 TaxID=3364375 RepID=UPI0037CA9CB7
MQEAEITERARVELAQLALGDRLRGAVGHELVLVLVSGERIAGVLGHLGKDWLVISQGTRQWLVPWWSVSFLEGLGRLVRKPSPGVGGSLVMASALRGLARNRAEVAVHVASAGQVSRVFEGVIDRVGSDHLDVAVTRGEARRAGAVVSVVTVPFAALVAVRSLGGQDY